MTTDVFDAQTRSRIMRAVKGKNTKPEQRVRSLLHSLGYRFRLHRKDLPGSPDIVLPGRRAVVFVHGCFWHGHDCKRGDRIPKTNAEYWRKKIKRNMDRDKGDQEELKELGWRVLVIWECEINDFDRLSFQFREFLESHLTSP